MPKGKCLRTVLPSSPGANGSSHHAAWRSARVLSRWHPIPRVRPAASDGMAQQTPVCPVAGKKQSCGRRRNLVRFCCGSNYAASNTATLKTSAGTFREIARLSFKSQLGSGLAATSRCVCSREPRRSRMRFEGLAPQVTGSERWKVNCTQKVFNDPSWRWAFCSRTLL